MTSSYTTNRYLEEPAYNDYSGNATGWSGPMNANLTAIDASFGSVLTVSTTGGTTALTNVQLRCATILVSGTLTSNALITIPSGVGGTWTIGNQTTGSYTVTVQVSGYSSTVVVGQGNYVDATSYGTGITLSNTAVGTAAGSNTQIMYNSGGGFAGSSLLTWSNGSAILAVQGELQFSGSVSGSVGFKAPSSGGSGVVWTLPSADGTAGQLLSTNGSGVLSWGGSSSGVTSFSAGSTGLTPSTASTGNVTLGGTLAVASGGTGVTTSTGSGSVVLATSPTISGLTATGTTSASTLNVSGVATFSSQPVISNNGGTGGTTYGGQFQLTNTYGSATNPNKYFRVNPTGGFEIINSAYSSVLSSLDDSGNLLVSGSVRGATTVSSYSGSTCGNFYCDGTNLYILKNGSANTGFDSARPFYVSLSTGAVTIDGTGLGASFGGQVSITGNLLCANIVGTSTSDAYTVCANPAASETAGGFMQVYGSTSGPGAQVILGAGNTTTMVLTYNNMAITGSITATGNITAYYSDERLKTDITTIPDALDKVAALKGVYFKSNDLAAQYGYTDQSRQVGVIAQDVQAVLPEVVKPAPFDLERDPKTETHHSKSGENYVTVQYDRLVPLLIEAIKELKEKVAILEARTA